MNGKKILKWCWFPILVLAAAAWLFYPVRFLKNIPPEQVARIAVFDGNTGEALDITDRADILYIVENLSGTPVRRTGISLLQMGYRFRMTFYNAAGEVLEQLTLNSNETIRRDPFFFTSEAGGLCYDYIWNLLDQEHDYLRVH